MEKWKGVVGRRRNRSTRIRDTWDMGTVMTCMAASGKGHAVARFAAALRQLKDRRGASYRDLAKRSLVSSAALHRYCTGDAVPTDFGTVSRIAHAFGATRDELADLHQQWIAARRAVEDLPPDGRLAEPAGAEAQAVHLIWPRHRGPAQLPADLRRFTGRDSYVDRLDEALRAASQSTAGALACVIAGTAGVGKTALAVHWAHRVRDRFPDGQLFINLRGFDPGGTITTPAEAIRRLLTSIGVSPAAMPTDLDSLIALYRTELDGKRILLVLDNARDAEQVRGLLPGTPTALALITSRNWMTSLVALDGAEQLVLDLFSPDEAMMLLSARLGADRVAAEPRAAAAIVARCARLPLALTVAVARAAQPSSSLVHVAEELADAGARLDFLSAGDPHSEVRSVFSWSYEQLTPPAATLFRYLGSHCGPDICGPAAAALLGVDPVEVPPLLSELTAAGLLNEEGPDRYAFHDLLRDYAGVLSRHHDTAEVRADVVDRMLCHYLSAACAADRVLSPLRDPVHHRIDSPGHLVVAPAPADTGQALAWFAAETPVLISALRLAVSSGRDSYTWHLAWSLTTFLKRRGPWHDLTWAWEGALAAARHLAHPLMQAEAHRHLVQCYTELSRYDEAWRHGQLALELCTDSGHPAGLAYTHYALAILAERQTDTACALHHAEAAHSCFVAADHPWGQATSLNGIGWCRTQLGDHEAALADCSQALALLRRLGDEHGQADTLDTMAYAHHRLARHDEAARCYATAIEVYRRLGDRYYEAGALLRLGDALHSGDRYDEALGAWREALSILEELDHRYAQQVLRRIEESRPAVSRRARSSAAPAVPVGVNATSATLDGGEPGSLVGM